MQDQDVHRPTASSPRLQARLARLGRQLQASGPPRPAAAAEPAGGATAVEGFTAAGFALPELGCFINGKWVSDTAEAHPVNSWDGTLVAKVAVAGAAQVDAAVAAARAALPAWRVTAPLERTAIINKWETHHQILLRATLTVTR